jgi:prepilin peptidase CpaA
MFRGTTPMNSISYGLLIALAIALVFAAFTDMRRRQIDNWLNAVIALAAPAFWWASGLSLWPDVAIQLGTALAAFGILAALFAFKVNWNTVDMYRIADEKMSPWVKKKLVEYLVSCC